jgi:hypothetical protein
MPPLEWGSWGWVYRAATAVTMAGCTLTNFQANLKYLLGYDDSTPYYYYSLWLNIKGGQMCHV